MRSVKSVLPAAFFFQERYAKVWARKMLLVIQAPEVANHVVVASYKIEDRRAMSNQEPGDGRAYGHSASINLAQEFALASGIVFSERRKCAGPTARDPQFGHDSSGTRLGRDRVPPVHRFVLTCIALQANPGRVPRLDPATRSQRKTSLWLRAGVRRPRTCDAKLLSI